MATVHGQSFPFCAMPHTAACTETPVSDVFITWGDNKCVYGDGAKLLMLGGKQNGDLATWAEFEGNSSHLCVHGGPGQSGDRRHTPNDPAPPTHSPAASWLYPQPGVSLFSQKILIPGAGLFHTLG